MDLTSLRLFVRAAELSSFSRAAVTMGVAQPTVSRIIGELEQDWGGALFYRTGRGVMLSELGEQALLRTRTLLREADQMSEDLRGFSKLPGGTVAIGLPPSIVAPTVPILLNELRRDLPNIHLQIFEGFGEQVGRWIAEGLIDIGLYSRYHEGERSPEPQLMASQLVLAGTSAGRTLPPEIDFAELADFPLVLPAQTNGLRVIVDTVARRMRVTLNVIVDVDSTLAQKQMCEHCGCYMIKAPHTISDDIDRRLFSSSLIRNPNINRHVVLVTGKQRPLSRAGREVARRVATILRAQPGF